MSLLRYQVLHILFLLTLIVSMSQANANYDYGQKQRLVQQVNRSYFAGDIIKVKQLFRLRQYNGQQLKRVVIVASGINANASLFINGQQVGISEYLNYGMQRVVFRVPEYQNILGTDIRTVQIRFFGGRVQVEKIVVVLNSGNTFPDPQRQGQTLRQSIFQSFGRNGNNKLFVGRALRFRQQNGKTLKEISIRAQATYGNSTAQLIINGRRVGFEKTITNYTQTIRFFIPNEANILGQDIRTVQIEFYGDTYVEEVLARIGNRNSRPPIQTRIDVRVNRILQRSIQITLADLLRGQIDYDQENAKVMQITIFARSVNNRGRLARLAICRPDGGCSFEKQLGTRTSSIQVNTNGRGRLNEISLRARGRVQIERIKVILVSRRY